MAPTRRPRLLQDKVDKLARAVGAASLEQAYDEVVAISRDVGVPHQARSLLAENLGSGDVDAILWAIRVADLDSYLPDDVLVKVDRSTMAVSLESRTPYFHPGVAELALSLPASQLIKDGRGKAPLRRLLANLLPDADFSQPKTGFGVPIGSLLRNELRDLMGDSIQTFHGRGGPPEVHDLPWDRWSESLMAGDDSYAHRLWSLVAFEIWASRLPAFPSWGP